METATRRAVRDLLAHGLRGDLAHSQVGIELGQHLQGVMTADVGDGAAVADIVGVMRDEAPDALTYARLLELLLVAQVDELQVVAGLTGDLEPFSPEVPPAPAPARRSARRPR